MLCCELFSVQVYRAVAVALILKRTLVFPRLRCYCFKNWFMSEQCRIPGDKVTQVWWLNKEEPRSQ